MENRVNRIVESYFTDFKDDMRSLINNLDIHKDYKTTLMEFLYNYKRLEITKENITKRKRVKNVLPVNDRCIACRANGEQCTRRRKDENEYCGTHVKNRPYGVITNMENTKNGKCTFCTIGVKNTFLVLERCRRRPFLSKNAFLFWNVAAGAFFGGKTCFWSGNVAAGAFLYTPQMPYPPNAYL